MRVAATCVERYVAVGAYASQEESYSPHVADALLVGGTPVVDHEYRALPHLFRMVSGFTVTKPKIYGAVGEYLGEGTSPGERNLIAVDKLASCGVESEVADIIFLHVVVEAVVLSRVDGIELVYLDKTQAPEIRLAVDEQAALLAHQSPFSGSPPVKCPSHPFYEILRCLSRGETYHPLRIVIDPFQKSHCGEFPELWEIIYRDVWHIGWEPTHGVAVIDLFYVAENRFHDMSANCVR